GYPMPDDQPVYGTGAVARRTQLTRQRLQYLIDRGKLPGPSLRVPGRWLFTEADVQRILEALGAHPHLHSSSPDNLRGGPPTGGWKQFPCPRSTCVGRPGTEGSACA